MNDLTDKANRAKNGKTPEEKIDALLQAFELFCQETGRLETAYAELQKEFQSVNLELEAANDNLQKKVEQLRSLSHYLESLVSHISQGLMFIDKDGIITTFNQAMESIFELKKKDVLGKNIKKIFSQTPFGNILLESLSHKEAQSYTTMTLSPLEKLIEVETKFIAPKEGSILNGIIVFVRDVTEIKRLEMLAARHDRMKELGELAAQVAHEIRNPLGGIKGYASLLKRDLKDQPELEKMADYIIDGTDDLNFLVTQVLDYSRPQKLQFQTINLKDMFLDLKSLIEHDPNLKPTPEITIKVDKNLHASLDPQLMRGALLNLMVNSCQAMPDGGKLVIKANQENNYIHFILSDTGYGIPEDLKKDIFSPFFTTKANGYGFGLAEVHKTVQAHGGVIHFTSDPQGTTFTIKIPQKAG